jgi:AraC family transcriptional regulator
MRKTTQQDYQQRLLRVLVYIQKNLDRDPTLAELAEVAHFSPYHFHRIFRGMVGESVRAYMRRLRLERAAGRLIMGDDPIIRIALDAGYESHAAFTRAFSTMTGLSPTEYRKQRRPLVSYAPHLRLAEDGSLAFAIPTTGGTTMDVTIKTIPERRVAFIRHTGPYAECGQAWSKLCMKLGPEGRLGPSAQFIGLSYDDPDVTPVDKIRYDACVTVGDDFEPEGEIGVQTVGGGTYAVTTHHGPYEEFSKTYAELCGQWIPKHERTIRAEPCLEVYLNDPESTPPAELLTDVYLPIEGDE